jgi:hypothetical protein
MRGGARQWRIYLHARLLQAGHQVQNLRGILKMRMGAAPVRPGEPCLVVSIRSFHHGRYGYQLLNYFALAGYRIVFYRSHGFLARLSGYDRMVLQLPGARLWARDMARGGRAFPWLRLGLGAGGHAPPFDVTVDLSVDLDYFGPADRTSGAFPLPYFVHPLLGRQLPVARNRRGQARRARVLMYGQPDLTTDPVLERHFGLAPRSRVFDALMGSDIPYFAPDDFARLLGWLEAAEPTGSRCCLIDSRKVWIPLDRWFEVLSCFDFFVATPGFCMPHAHNLIEAMAVGTIPILQYHHHLRPALRPGVDCIAFGDGESAVTAVEAALRMPDAEVATLRQGVLDYFDREVDPMAVVPRIFSRAAGAAGLRLLFNAEEISLRLPGAPGAPGRP